MSIKDKKHNILIKGKAPRRGHQMATDGKSHIEAEEKKRKKDEKGFLNEQFMTLKKKGFKCEVIEREGMKPAIIGTANGHPFIVFMKFMKRGNEWAAITTTRYEGKELDMKPPYEILK